MRFFRQLARPLKYAPELHSRLDRALARRRRPRRVARPDSPRPRSAGCSFFSPPHPRFSIPPRSPPLLLQARGGRGERRSDARPPGERGGCGADSSSSPRPHKLAPPDERLEGGAEGGDHSDDAPRRRARSRVTDRPPGRELARGQDDPDVQPRRAPALRRPEHVSEGAVLRGRPRRRAVRRDVHRRSV